MKTIKVALKS